jgi:hypothetical protein
MVIATWYPSINRRRRFFKNREFLLYTQPPPAFQMNPEFVSAARLQETMIREIDLLISSLLVCGLASN